MRRFFTEYEEAYQYAQSYADRTGQSMGIEKKNSPIERGYLVLMLPKPENRRGYELRCQAVEPS